jgi:hypothetical protein
MTDPLDLVGDLSTLVKIGWIGWLAWVVVQVGWYRHARPATAVLDFVPIHSPAASASRADIRRAEPASVSLPPEQASVSTAATVVLDPPAAELKSPDGVAPAETRKRRGRVTGRATTSSTMMSTDFAEGLRAAAGGRASKKSPGSPIANAG